MRFLISILIFLVAAQMGMSPPHGPSASSQPASGPTTRSSLSKKVERLVESLGHRKYKTRESAQQQLAALGEAALPDIVKYINHADPEISRRVQQLVRRPEDPTLRIETVTRLIASGDPSLVETGVYMLFKAPLVDYPLFKEVTDRSVGIERVMFDPICEQLSQWRQMTERHEARQARLLVEKPDAARERELHEGTYFYHAEAAYVTAVEAAEEYRETHLKLPPAATQPANAPPKTTSRPDRAP